MQCPRCQQDAPSDAEFCPECGTKLGAVCAQCGTANASGHKFCKRCGRPLTSAVEARPEGGRFGSPESYTPKNLAEKILTSKASLEGERKQVTVLFADLKGSMELLADRDPEEARKLLDPVLEHMMEAVHRYEGTVNQVMGDGIMALFGAPIAHEDHAVRACYAALRMQDAVKRYAESVRRTAGVPVQIRVGMNSGEVLVRSIGSDLHMDYTAVGQTTHLAARMEQMALPGTSLLAASTLGLAEGFVQVQSLGPMSVKGLKEPVEVFELMGAGAVRTRIQAARGLSRFVGRDAELEQLHKSIELAGRGRGQVTAVVGEPGVGKSRLAFELTRSHRTQGWLVLEGRSVSYGRTTSYLPVVELLKGYFRIDERDTPRGIREKLTGRVLALDRALEPTLPALLALLDGDGSDAKWQDLEPSARRQQTINAVKGLLLREAQVQPLVLLFEDLHWIDSETQAILDGLVEALPAVPILLLVNYRPEYQHRWGGRTSYTQVRLDPLHPAGARELLKSLLGTDPTTDHLKSLLIERTEGNPFFLEEMVRTLAETKALSGDRGAYKFHDTATDVQTPPTVQAVLAARIDRLSPEDKRLLQAAAVIGRDVPYALLAGIVEDGEASVREGLGHLLEGEFIYEVSLFPNLVYAFKHALTHEVAYGGALHSRRKSLHAAAIDIMERLYRDRIDEHVPELAQHALRAEQWTKAVMYCRRAAARALAQDAARKAVEHIERALGALANAPDDRAAKEEAFALYDMRRNAFQILGDLTGIERSIRDAAALADALDDPARQARVAGIMCNYLQVTGRVEHAVREGERAVALAEGAGGGNLLRQSRFFLGQARYAAGDYQHAVAAFEKATTRTDEASLRPGGGGNPHAFLAASLAELGQFSRALQAIELADVDASAQRAPGYVTARWAAGIVLIRQGDAHRAVTELRRGLDAAEERGAALWHPIVKAALGLAEGLAGHTAAGRALLEESILTARTRLPRIVPFSLSSLAWIHRLDDRLDAATKSGEESIASAERQGMYGDLAWCTWIVGDIELTAGNLERAEMRYREAHDLAAPRGMRPLVAHYHLGLGMLYRSTGKREEAQDHVATATGMYREMGMTYWLEKAEQELKG